jgi:hypothetical protein
MAKNIRRAERNEDEKMNHLLDSSWTKEVIPGMYRYDHDTD